MASSRVVFSELTLPEKERFYEFLVANKVEFVSSQGGQSYVASIRVVPPEPSTARLNGRVRQATKTTRSASENPGNRTRASASTSTAASAHQDAATTLKAAQSVLRRRYTRFCNVLPALTQPPKALGKISLVRFFEEVYDARWEKDTAYVQNIGEGSSKLPQAFPEFVYDYAAKRYGLKALVCTNCWGMVSSVELMRGRDPGIDLYGKFLEETYDVTDLLFFLFARSACEKVMPQDQADKSRSDNESGTTNKKKGLKSFAPTKLEARQVYQVVRTTIDRENKELQNKILSRLDSLMDPRTNDDSPSGRPPTLDRDRLLAIATEEYHNSRDLAEEPEEVPVQRVQKVIPRGTMLNEDGEVEDLTPEIRKEVRRVTSRLVASLSAQGQREVVPQEVYDWARNVTLRRHRIGDLLEQETEQTNVVMDIEEMKGAALTLTEGNAPESTALDPEKILNMSPEEFEKNLEDNVRQLLLTATLELVNDSVGALPEHIWQDESVAVTMRGALISEFAPIADTIMEAIVAKDYRRWLGALTISGNGSINHRQQFEKLHEEFQQVLSSEISGLVVQGICRNVVSVAELQDNVRARALSLSKMGNKKKPGVDDDEEGF